MRPRIIKELHQQRIASRDHLRAVANILQHLGLDLDVMYPSESLKALNPLNERREVHVMGGQSFGYVINIHTAECRWDTLFEDASHVRLILSPDEGAPLYCAYISLACSGAAVAFNRDELHLG